MGFFSERENKKDMDRIDFIQSKNPNPVSSQDYYRFKKDYEKVFGVVSDETYRRYCRQAFSQAFPDEDLNQAIIQAKDHQKLQDKLRVSRKISREDFRVYNFLEEKTDKILELLENINLKQIKTKEHKVEKDSPVAILHIGDTHIGETIDLPINKFNMEVASKRLKKLISKTKNYLKTYDIKNLILVFSGDLINHDHVIDKMVLNADHKTKAMLQSTYLFEQMILDLNEVCNITITSVVGNESRKYDHNPHDERLVTHSYDYDIHNFLKVIFKDKKGINILDGSFKEKVIKVLNSNILIIHGDTLKGNYEKSIKDLMARHSIAGNPIRFILTGHIHNHIISPYLSRVSGLPGANGYSESFNFLGRAGQNLHFLFEDESIESIAIDLQTYDGYEPYNLEERLISHKEVEDISTKKTIIEIVV